ncbi:MAG: MFS transporter [Zavarzinella sp.]|nr:MFS transporter [Zavarzinella sp.]
MPVRLSASVRGLVVICAASALWGSNFGAGAPTASLWLRDHGSHDTVIGLNTAVYYFGIALTAPFVPWLMHRTGRGCIIFGMVLSGLTVALFPWAGGPAGWFALRWLNGVAAAMSLIPMETEVNHSAAPEHRSRNFGLYAVSMALGIAAGTGLGLDFYADGPSLVFALAGVPALLAAGLIGVCPGAFVPPPQETGRCPELAVRRNVLTFGSAWGQGFLEGGMVGHLAVYLLFLGMSEGATSWVVSGIMIGIIVSQVPVAWLADRFGRTGALLACYAATVAALTVMPFCGPSAWLVAALLVAGACSTAFYPLGVTLLGERLPPSALARGNARFLMFNCLGSLAGPAVAGVTMDLFGKPALFVSAGAALLLVLATWGVQRYVERQMARTSGQVDAEAMTGREVSESSVQPIGRAA